MTPEQEKILSSPLPIIVLAGPGTGKTFVLTKRLEKHPASIFLTFSCSAAWEVRTRLKELPQPFLSGTFHSVAFRLLRSLFPLKILSPSSAYHLFSTIQFPPDSPQPSPEIFNTIEYSRLTFRPLPPPMQLMKEIYEKTLTEANLADFTHLLTLFLYLLRTRKEEIEEHLKIYSTVFVDEGQDLDPIQIEILKTLASFGMKFFLVTSPSQSIYAFRGAHPGGLIDFARSIQAREIVLDTNFRSTPQIVSLASSILPSSPETKQKTVKGDGEKVKIVFSSDEDKENVVILQIVHRLLQKFPKVAILARTRSRIRSIEQVLLHEKIPYSLLFDTSLFSTPEASLLISLMKFPFDETDEAVDSIIRYFLPILPHISPENGKYTLHSLALSFSSEEALELFNLLESIQMTSPDEDVCTFLSSIYQTVVKFISRAYPLDFRQRLGNLRAFYNFVQTVPEKIQDFLLNLPFLQEEGIKNNLGPVVLGTIHSAKGLEWPAVVICGLTEGLLPLSNSDLDEERRLFYVGVTRAKDFLVLSVCGKPSRFIFELDQTVCELYK